MRGLDYGSGKIRIAQIFKTLMWVALLFAFMPSLLRLGDSRLSFAYLYTLFCIAVWALIVLRNARLTHFYMQLGRQNKLLFFSVFILFLLHVVRYILTPENGLMSRTLMALLVFTTMYLYFTFLFYLDDRNFYTFYRVISIGLVLNLIAITLHANGIEIIPASYPGYDRYAGLYSHPNQLAIVVSTVFIFYVANFFSDAGLMDRLKSLSMFIVALVVSILAGSKTNIVISGVLLAMYLLWSVSRRNALVILLTLIGLILLLGYAGSSDLLLRLNPRLFSVVSELSLNNVMDYRTVQSRLVLWAYSWDVGMAYPFAGEGFGKLIFGDVEHSHNVLMDYLRIFGPSGMLFFGLFLLAIISLFTRSAAGIRDPHVVKACKLSVLAYLLANMMSDSMGPQTVFFLTFFVAYLSVIPGKVYTLRPNAVAASADVNFYQAVRLAPGRKLQVLPT